MSGLLNTLASGDIFRDMSLGSETVNAAQALAQRALQESGAAQRAALKSLSGILEQAEQEASDQAEQEAVSAARERVNAAQQRAQQQANEEYRQSDPGRNYDHQRVVEESNMSTPKKRKANEQIHGVSDPEVQQAEDGPQSREVSEVKQLKSEVGENWVQGKVLLANFEIDSHELRGEHKKFLRNQLYPNLSSEGRITLIEGHASETGDPQHNKQLSEKRAEAVERFLVEELGLPSHRILNVKGVGETEQVNADGPLEDPAERSVIVGYEAYTPEPIIRRPETKVKDDEGRRFTKWEIEFQFDHSDNLDDIIVDDSPSDLVKQMLDQKSIKVRLQNREENDARTLTGYIVYRGLEIGIWLTTPPGEGSWSQPFEFETQNPLAEMEWHGKTGQIQIGKAATGGFTSGVTAIVLRLAPMRNSIEAKARLTADDKAIGIQGNTSLLSPLPAQLWLTDPKPKRTRDGWDWELGF